VIDGAHLGPILPHVSNYVCMGTDTHKGRTVPNNDIRLLSSGDAAKLALLGATDARSPAIAI
jgi:hypothetical protein